MEIKLTKADKIILKNLEHNPRILEKKLAKKCNLSKDSIRYRINRLEKLGVIKGYGAFVDYVVLGYKSFKLYLRLNATSEQKQQMRKFLENEKSVFAIFEAHGNWDMAIAIFAKNRLDYHEFENKLLSKFGGIIGSKEFCLMMDGVIFDNNLIYDEKIIKEHRFWRGSLIGNIDEKDKILLNELHKNSRESLANLSEKIGLSIDAVSKRIKKLDHKNVIQFYTTKIDYNLLGYETYKLFIYTKKYSNEIEKQLFEFLKNQKNIMNIVRILGGWKLEVEFLVKEYSEFEKILSEMQKKFSDSIQKLDFSVFRNEVWFPSDKLLV